MGNLGPCLWASGASSGIIPDMSHARDEFSQSVFPIQRSLALIVSGFVAIGALSGCAGSSTAGNSSSLPTATTSAQTPSSTPTAAATQAPSPTPTATATQAPSSPFTISGTMPLKDTKGYSAEISYTAQSPNGFVGDITQAAPGFTDFVITTKANAVITNTTPGRSAPMNVLAQFEAVYSIDSGLCSNKYPAANVIVGLSPNVAISPSGGEYCVISTAPQRAQLEAVAAGASSKMQLAALSEGNRLAKVPESAGMGPVLNAPLAVVFMVAKEGGWEPTTPHCAIQVGNEYKQVTYFALSAEAGPLCK